MVLQQPDCEGSGKNLVCVQRILEPLICSLTPQTFKENAIPFFILAHVAHLDLHFVGLGLEGHVIPPPV